jgi:hypothetical protein
VPVYPASTTAERVHLNKVKIGNRIKRQFIAAEAEDGMWS